MINYSTQAYVLLIAGGMV